MEAESKYTTNIDKYTFLALADYIMIISSEEKDREQFPFYSSDRRRSELHDEICKLLEINREDTLKITNNLNKYVSLNHEKLIWDDKFMSEQVKKFYKALNSTKNSSEVKNP
ncbi:MAG: hypothetical protein K9M13_02070 [Simkaniaceae bacterium]|nr:hypothetical protein [Simkaniaceae bacterium]